MSNVIRLTVPIRAQGEAARHAALLSCFALHRRGEGDVFWLKENAELLNILECTGARPGAEALAPLLPLYERAERRLAFFPQYYRFLLSIVLDLEDLGLPGETGARLCARAAADGLAEAELSDLQRAEARRLMARRGVASSADPGLDDRLRAFIGRPETFALPNKKAAYELTHIVFYLSDYGRRDPGLEPAAIASLENAALLSYLEQNADLLAEICIALRFAGIAPSPIWEDWLATELRGFTVLEGARSDLAPDEYHDYLMCAWADRLRGGAGFIKPASAGRMSFWRGPRGAAPLRQMSEWLFRLEDARSGDWRAMAPRLRAALSAPAQQILSAAEASSERFAEFFAGFARPEAQA
ncbi:DUF6902 family protein [Pseudodonghicola sp.]|uniref:DUF6902 family protein n=1 Tax=Pseudodonghicola sp. TaxID=1969463 RepID=UPI003A983899